MSLTTDEYNVQLKVRNNYLLQMMRSWGFNTAAELSRATGVSQIAIGEYLNLKATPYRKGRNTRPRLKKNVEALCDFFACSVLDLFPEENLDHPLKTNLTEVSLSSRDVASITSSLSPDALLETEESYAALHKALAALTERERKIISDRHGLDGQRKKLFSEIAGELGCSSQRVRMIEGKAMLKLCRPEFSLKHHVDP